MNAIHPPPFKSNETIDPATSVAETAVPDTRAALRPGLDDRPPAELKLVDRDSVPPVAGDPAVVAAEEAAEAAVVWDAYAKVHPTVDDERTPEFEAVKEQSLKADDAFADAPVTSAAGALLKMREIAEMTMMDHSDTGLEARHFKTVVAFLEGIAAAPPVVADDPAVAAFAQFMEAKAAVEAFPDDEAVAETPEYLAAGDRRYEAGNAVYDAAPTSLAGVAAKMRFLVDHGERGNDLWCPFDCMAKSLLPFLEGGAANRSGTQGVIAGA